MAGRIPKLVVVGPSYIDMTVKCIKCPGPGETAEGTGFSCMPTGPGPNRALEAALCGCEVSLLSKVGDDVFGQMVRQNLQQHGIDTGFVYEAKAISTGIVVTMVNSIGENSCCISPGANRALSGDEVACAAAEHLIGTADVCLVHADLSRDVVTTAIKIANRHDTKVILEAPLRMLNNNRADDIDWPIEYYSADILIPDFMNCFAETESAAGKIGRLKFIGSELVAKGFGSVIIKMGARGTVLIDRGGTTHIAEFDIERVDQTACGDAFAGALAASCGAGDEPVKAVRFAAAAEALACGKFGSQDALPAKEEIIELLQKQTD